MKNNELLQRAFSMLSRRAYSENELRQKLIKRGCANDELDEVICYLSERGYLNDTALCNALVRKYIHCGKYGKKAIMSKIRQRGVSREIVQEVMAMHNFDELSQAICLVKKIFSKSDGEFNKVKIGRFLVNRGFDYNTIQQIFEHLNNTDYK